jgi:hypothetical protein
MQIFLEIIIAGYFFLALFFLLNRKFTFFSSIDNEKYLNRLGVISLWANFFGLLLLMYDYYTSSLTENPLVPAYWDMYNYIEWTFFILAITINIKKEWRCFWPIIILNILLSVHMFRIYVKSLLEDLLINGYFATNIKFLWLNIVFSLLSAL